MKIELVNYTENPIMNVERVACVCYDSTPKEGKIANSCYKNGHHSVWEFCDFTFHIQGISRACSHELVRHRIASYAQRSQRYCSEDNFGFTIPLSILKNDEIYKEYSSLMEEIKQFYSKMLAFNIPKEDARMILPNASETEIYVKMNGRSLMNFMNLRLCSKAQSEIRELANKMKMEIMKVAPEMTKYLVPKCEANPEFYFCTERLSCGRHPNISSIKKTLENESEE